MMNEHTTELRVRYSETDAMGFLHHSNYLTYFEIGRTELFRAQGGSYRRMEEMGHFLVVAKVNVHFRRPARYDDLLTLTTRIDRISPARIEHSYKLYRGEELLTEGNSVIACVDTNGQLQRIPDDMIDVSSS
ncbi:MAG: acyl-CoA thioesterase [Planctomycetaceae bacterium]|nr:acyl-CoA thioesterase [Planctomycetaceae bacterium]